MRSGNRRAKVHTRLNALELVELFFSLCNLNVLLRDFERLATAATLERHAARIDQRLLGRNVHLARGAGAKDCARVEEFLGRLAALAGARLLVIGAQRGRREKREGTGGQVNSGQSEGRHRMNTTRSDEKSLRGRDACCEICELPSWVQR